jgi:hypothetical protein
MSSMIDENITIYEALQKVKDHRHSRWLEDAPLKGAIHLQILFFFFLLLITILPYPTLLFL